MKQKIDCSVCHSKNCVEVITHTEDIPYFGEIMETVLICGKCGFKHTDIIGLEQKEPCKYSLKVNKSNLNARVVKSQSATIIIPELGLKVEPGSKSQGYVSNVEGVLNRFVDAVKTALEWVEDSEAEKNGKRILEEIEKIKSGDKSVTIIIKDPFGQSIIIHDDVFKEKLSEKELKNLKTGFITIEK
ncbi:MAG: ZPR1 zinc finger domain-containing protein [Methanobacteriaceae archaeon]|nr:ZPR1 zinc finger domain-containing protein [Methanobacteriaceae archaeon]